VVVVALSFGFFFFLELCSFKGVRDEACWARVRVR